MRFTLALLVVPLLALGCARQQSYQVAVRNESEAPLTVGLVKEGGTFESEWASPEEIAAATRADEQRKWDAATVQRGQTGVAGPIKGTFGDDARAVLRVYAGGAEMDEEMDELMAISRGSPDRIDVPLRPGRNAIIVRREKGRLVYERANLPRRK
jgi:hypothetical protein